MKRILLVAGAVVLSYACADPAVPNPETDQIGRAVVGVASVAASTSQTSRITFVAERENGPQVWLMDQDGSNQERLTNIPGTHNQSPDWSPSETQIAFACHAPGPQDDICVINSDGTGYVRFDTPWRDQQPRWSPDGTKLLFSSDRYGSQDVFVMDAATGGNVTLLFQSPGHDHHAVWSPDGEGIAFRTDLGTGNGDIYTLRLATQVLTRITDHSAEDYSPAWSPDGGRIAFASTRSESSELYLADADTLEGHVLRLTFNAAQPRANGRPTWSPDGQWLAFDSNVHSGAPYDVFKLLVADPTLVLNLSNHTTNDEQPHWGGRPVVNPTTPEDCRNGGWMRYGFKNQGQCVRYLQAGKDGR